MRQLVIASAKRTPMGAFLGQLSSLTAPQLAAALIQSTLKDNPLIIEHIDELLLGCVLTAGVGQAPARQASLLAGLPLGVPCTTVNKVCGSGMKAVAMAMDRVLAGQADVIIAGGMESMSHAPYLLDRKSKAKMGHQNLYDHMFYDGLENPADRQLMGCFAERCAEQYDFSRQQQDAYAVESLKRANKATQSTAFKNELVCLAGLECDEQVVNANIEKIADLKPVFKPDGTVTAANSSSLSDGAAIVLVAEESKAKQLGLQVLARIKGYTQHAQAAEDFTTAVHGSYEKLLSLLNWQPQDVDLIEINEAFAVVVLVAMRSLQLDHNKVNVNGGACAMGHPIGASGCRILVSLVHAMQQAHVQKGIASICIGGGESMSMAIEI